MPASRRGGMNCRRWAVHTKARMSTPPRDCRNCIPSTCRRHLTSTRYMKCSREESMPGYGYFRKVTRLSPRRRQPEHPRKRANAELTEIETNRVVDDSES